MLKAQLSFSNPPHIRRVNKILIAVIHSVVNSFRYDGFNAPNLSSAGSGSYSRIVMTVTASRDRAHGLSHQITLYSTQDLKGSTRIP